MAKFQVSMNKFRVSLTFQERAALSRPDIVLEANRLTSTELGKLPSKRDLGTRISKRGLFSGITREYRAGTKKILVIGKSGSGKSCLKIKFSHPTLDELWYCGTDADKVKVIVDQALGI